MNEFNDDFDPVDDSYLLKEYRNELIDQIKNILNAYQDNDKKVSIKKINKILKSLKK